MEQAAQEQWAWPQVLEFKGCLDIALRQRVWILGGAVWSQELDLVVLTCPFQLRRFCQGRVAAGWWTRGMNMGMQEVGQSREKALHSKQEMGRSSFLLLVLSEPHLASSASTQPEVLSI